MATLADYGEDRLVASLLARLPPAVLSGREIVAGAGDDCAVVASVGEGQLQLLKTDCVVEGVHYTADTPPERVGWKALCRPLSDIAAMAGRPQYALITLGLPATRPAEYAHLIYTGLGRAAERYGVRVVGGETARSPGAGFLSVMLSGTVEAKRLATRAGAKLGHLIYVTGLLGGSLPSGKHLDFTPRLDEARWLAAHFDISAMMDLSDGLAHDLPRLAKASGAGFAVARGLLPCTPGCTPSQAVSDGEDYELLFTIAPEARQDLEWRWRECWPGLPLTNIGEIRPAGQSVGLEADSGFDHFASPR